MCSNGIRNNQLWLRFCLLSLFLFCLSLPVYSQQADLQALSQEVAQMVKKYPDIKPLLQKILSELDRIQIQSSESQKKSETKINELLTQISNLEASQMRYEKDSMKIQNDLQDYANGLEIQRNISIGGNIALTIVVIWEAVKLSSK